MATRGSSGGGHGARSSSSGGALRSAASRKAGQDIAGVTKVLPTSEIKRIKNRAVILTDSEAKQLKQSHKEQVAATRHGSEERKRRMVEKELQARARREQSAMEMELDTDKKALLTSDKVLRNQHLTSIRCINSLALQASGYKLCDQLKGHKQEREQMETRYDTTHDSIMERERVTELQVRKEREAEAHAKRIEARHMLEQQIVERQKKAIWEEEAEAAEAQKILSAYKQYEAEEQKKIEQQHDKMKTMMQDVARTNERIKQMKDDAIQREKQEEMVVAAYLRKKAMEEEAKVKEEQRIRKSKELRIAKLRAQQEKAQGKQAIQDEFRAKKASEEAETNTRAKEKRDSEAKEALVQTILRDRKRQEAFHEAQKQQQRQQDLHIDAIMQEHVEQEFQHQRAALLAAKEREKKHGEQVRQQIEANAQQRQKPKLFEHNDAKFLKKKSMKESILAEKVRQDALRRLQKQGVPEEYLHELTHMIINEANA